MGIADRDNYTMEAKYVDDGAWNGTPVIQVSDYRKSGCAACFRIEWLGHATERNTQCAEISILRSTTAAARPGYRWGSSSALLVNLRDRLRLEANDDVSNPNGWNTLNLSQTDSDYAHSVTLDITGETKFLLPRPRGQCRNEAIGDMVDAME